LGVNAQIVTLTPTIVTQNDTVTVTFDATQGNAGLVGVSPVYMHTGVVTNLSATPTAWRHVQGNWGTADPKVLMTSIGNNKHQLKYHINTFYNVPANETVLSLAFVFRNVDGSKEGKTAGGGDIFVPISQGGFTAFISSHTSRQYVYAPTDTMKLIANASSNSTLKFKVDGVVAGTVLDTNTFSLNLILSNYSLGFHEITMIATDTSAQTKTDTVYILTRSGNPIGVLPGYAEEGLKSLNDSTMYFQLRAPYKNFAYLVGDFNDWLLKPEYEMYKTPDGQFFFGEISGLDKNVEYGFQYFIGDDGMLITDPYAEKILDPWNDGYIPNATYPNLKDYPVGKTAEIVGVFQIEEPAYTWSGTNYQRPAKEELVIYELLVRDFASAHNYNAVIEKLDYLQWLGINAIELMPVMEFEGNESWGYNPMFMMAPDKYYGPKNELKRLVDSCHARGMAVILDIALNHSFGQNPMVRMYFDPNAGQWGQTTAQSPWFNAVAKHDFNVGYDYNHQSAATKYYSKKVIAHWLTEYKIDGYRFDLSKGFTQVNTLGNTAAWGNLDQSRINIWKDYTSHLWSVDSTAYVILEHFADNSEETVLSNENMMLWGNMNHAYTEAAMGYAADLTGVSHKSRNWNDMHLVGFMESHDEERMMYKTPKFGNSNATYTTRNLDTALQRMELAAAFFYTMPGPKMLWQFGELGYDYSINHCPDGTINNNCRISNKPIRWDYFSEENRRQLYNVVGELNHLRKTYPVFRQDKQAELSLSGVTKRIKLQDSTMQVVVIGNFDIISKSINPAFHQTGLWYEHFSGDSLDVTNTAAQILLTPGEYRLYTTQKMARSAIGVEEESAMQNQTPSSAAYPSPFTADVTFSVQNLPSNGTATITVTDLSGKAIWQASAPAQKGEELRVIWPASNQQIPVGMYLYHISAPRFISSGKLIKH
jgi:1,4-alpha-glucan branching enzyme